MRIVAAPQAEAGKSVRGRCGVGERITADWGVRLLDMWARTLLTRRLKVRRCPVCCNLWICDLRGTGERL
jgi:hypothetical protein